MFKISEHWIIYLIMDFKFVVVIYSFWLYINIFGWVIQIRNIIFLYDSINNNKSIWKGNRRRRLNRNFNFVNIKVKCNINFINEIRVNWNGHQY